MINDFQGFGLVHLSSIFIALLIGLIFIYFSSKTKNVKKLSLILAITIILIRSTRYFFDMYLGVFSLVDLVSIHVCHIDLILLIICLLKPNRNIFVFTFLIGIPTALMVALFPGPNHPEPGLLRAIFFIMSHTMLVITPIYIMKVNKFKIFKKDLLRYYTVSFFGILLMFHINMFLKTNYMYLIEAPKNTLLETIYNATGPFLYVFAIYSILVLLFTILYFIYLVFFQKLTHES